MKWNEYTKCDDYVRHVFSNGATLTKVSNHPGLQQFKYAHRGPIHSPAFKKPTGGAGAAEKEASHRKAAFLEELGRFFAGSNATHALLQEPHPADFASLAPGVA